MATSIFTLLVCFTISLHFSSGSFLTSTVVNTTYGPVNGSVIPLPTNKTIVAYKGIPFAKAERFEDPVPPDEWSSILQANTIDKICPQTLLPPNKNSLMSEDCLHLNVYVPGNATSSSALAVLLWIHGGGFSFGDTTIYDGSVVATEGNVIVVTIAYRLGAFGFLSSNSDDLRGNYGMMDQIAALKWVNKNIARFGGDPNRVTIFGVSAGGMSVALLLLSPLASGLYQNVIIQSGSALALAALLERDEAEIRARSFAEAAGCDITTLKTCLKKKSLQELVAAQEKVFNVPNYVSFSPVLDGFFMPDYPIKLLQEGKFNKSNIIIGVTRDDGTIFASGSPGLLQQLDLSNGISRPLFIEVINNRTWIRNQNSQMTKLLAYEYTDWSNATDPILLRRQFIDMNTDANFKAPAIQSAKAFLKKQSPTYFYQLEIAPKSFPGFPTKIYEWQGIFHGAEFLYLFGLPLILPIGSVNPGEVQATNNMITFWTNFAKSGNPNTPTPLSTTWPQYTADQREYLGLGANLTLRSDMRPDKMALWNEFLPSIEEPVMPTATCPTPIISGGPDGNKDKLVMILVTLAGLSGAN